MKCKNCKNLNRKIEWSPVTYQYPWCYEINDSPDIERERECSKYCGKTNGDKIRRMTDEELAEWILEKDDNWENICKQCKTDTYCEDDIDCKIAILNWLQKEVE